MDLGVHDQYSYRMPEQMERIPLFAVARVCVTLASTKYSRSTFFSPFWGFPYQSCTLGKTCPYYEGVTSKPRKDFRNSCSMASGQWFRASSWT